MYTIDNSRSNYSSQVTSQSPSPAEAVSTVAASTASTATANSTPLLQQLAPQQQQPPSSSSSVSGNSMITNWHEYHDSVVGNSSYDSSSNFHWHSTAMMTLEPPLPPLLPPVPIHETTASSIHDSVSTLNSLHHQHSTSPNSATLIDYQSGHHHHGNLNVTPNNVTHHHHHHLHHQLTNLDSSVHSSYLPLAPAHPHQLNSATSSSYSPSNSNINSNNSGHSGSPLIHHMLTGSYHSSPTSIIGQTGNFITEGHNASSLDAIGATGGPGGGLSDQSSSNHLLLSDHHHHSTSAITGSSDGPIITELGPPPPTTASTSSRSDIPGSSENTSLADVSTDGTVGDRSSTGER